MLDLVLKLIRALLASLYMLFEGLPALESLKSWVGASGRGRAQISIALLLATAALLGALAFLAFLWLLKRSPLGERGSALLRGFAGRDDAPGKEPK